MLLFFLQDSVMFPAIAQTPWWKAILVAVIGMTLLPVAGGGWFDVRGWGENANTVIGGWNVYQPQQAYIGLTRLLFPFFCGLLLSRFHAHIKVKGGFWWCAVLVAAILAMPYIPGGIKGTPGSLNGWYNALAILVLFPLIVAMWAGSTITEKIGPKVCRFFGDISFPLYITHYPLMYCQMAWAMNHSLYDRSGVMIGSLG